MKCWLLMYGLYLDDVREQIYRLPTRVCQIQKTNYRCFGLEKSDCCYILVLLEKTSLTRLVWDWTHQPIVPHELGVSWILIRLIRGFPSYFLDVTSSSTSILLHIFWTNSFNASLSFFALALVIGPISTSN